MSKPLVDRIGETRKKWMLELNECRRALIDPPKTNVYIPYRMVLELDYLLVEAKLALDANGGRDDVTDTAEAEKLYEEYLESMRGE